MFAATTATFQMLWRAGKHEEAITAFHKTPNAYNTVTLIGHYSKLETPNLDRCFATYRALVSAGCQPDLFVFTALLNACHRCYKYDKALYVWHEMSALGIIPDQMCFAKLTATCVKTGNSVVGEQLFSLFEKNAGIAANDLDCAQLFQTFCGTHNHLMVAKVLEFMRKHFQQLSVAASLNLIKSCADLGELSVAKQLHTYLIKLGTSNFFKAKTALMSMYSHCGSLEDVWALFHSFGASADTVVFNTMLQAVAHLGKLDSAIALANLMQATGVEPDNITHNILIGLYAKAGQVDKA